MKYLRLFKCLTVDPVSLSIKAKCLSLMACFCSILFIAFSTAVFFPWTGYPMLVASMGASSIILFFIPSSPLAQPWPLVGGQLVSAVVGVFCALNIAEIPIAAAAAVGGSVLMMLLLRCLHPPAAATSLTPVTAGAAITSLGYSFVIVPVAINAVGMLLLAIYFNRLMVRDYPSPLPTQKKRDQRVTEKTSGQRLGFSAQDLELALEESDVFIDMTHAELSHILTRAEINTFKRIKGPVLCADIMMTDVVTVEFGREVEEAWELMRVNQMKAMPVIDRAQRVSGIVTWDDFFKFMDLKVYPDLQDEVRRFIRRTTELKASKPEFVGQIMSHPVVTLPDSAHIVELIPWMSAKDCRQIPIVNSEQRLVGMVYQEDLIAGLYREELALQVSA